MLRPGNRNGGARRSAADAVNGQRLGGHIARGSETADAEERGTLKGWFAGRGERRTPKAL